MSLYTKGANGTDWEGIKSDGLEISIERQIKHWKKNTHKKNTSWIRGLCALETSIASWRKLRAWAAWNPPFSLTISRKRWHLLRSGGSGSEEQPVETVRPGGEIEGTGEEQERAVHRHSGHSREKHPKSPAGVAQVERSPLAGKPSITRDQRSESELKAESW